ncbi:MAG: acetate/propionate family kinase [Pseudomonadota bacterium]
MTASVLTLNAGSSSLKFALFEEADAAPTLRGQVDRIGGAGRILADGAEFDRIDKAVTVQDHTAALAEALALIEARLGTLKPAAVGHRIVHGGPAHDRPVLLDPAVIAGLEALRPFAPLHQPHNLSGIYAAQQAFPDAHQIGCFDTGFHRSQPKLNRVFALPHRYYEQGICRYGFHGLSYAHISRVLAAEHADLAPGRVVVAHLGNGASICALKEGQSVASTMGFSALDGLPMGTRCGQIDPGVLLYMMTEERMDAAAIQRLLYHEAGLLGLSGISNDMRELEAASDPQAALAIDYFAARIQRETGAFAAVLQGVDALVFTAGIGEHSATLRARVCDGLGWLGIALDPARNRVHAREISDETSPVKVLVIPTDEEAEIARSARALLDA